MPKKILNIEDSSTDDNTDNEEEEEVLTKPIKKEKGAYRRLIIKFSSKFRSPLFHF